MIRASAFVIALFAVLAVPAASHARPLGLELWTDRGQDAVYEPGDGIQIKARTSDDAYLLVYEIDSEGYVHLLFPQRSGPSFIDGRQTFRIPDAASRDQLVVEGPTGEGYIVAIASRDPFESLPWYLRPYDPQAAQVGYIGREDAEDGVTGEGRIVGDPFVAMERIRRAVLNDPEDRDEFATAYTSYYVHERVRYPRYMCYDCHRPGYWRWWDGFDPYYASCSVFDFRVNWGWSWGPTYWFNCVPYYVFVVRNDCPPHYRPSSGFCFSSWDGWSRWNRLWGGRLVRYKTDAPPQYVPPASYGWENRKPGVKPMPVRPAPPGFLAAEIKGRGVRPVPVQRVADEQPIVPRVDWRPGGELKKPDVGRMPSLGPARDADPVGGRIERTPREARPEGGLRPAPGTEGWERPGRGPRELETPRATPPSTPRRIERDPVGRGPEVREAPWYDRRPLREAPRIDRPSNQGRGERGIERQAPRVERAPERPAPRVERGDRGGERPAPRIERSAPPRKEPPRQEPAHEDKGNEEKGKGRG